MQSSQPRRLGTDLLLYYIKYEQTEEVLNMIHQREVFINDVDINGMTPLQVAVELQLTRMVQLLLQLGADPNIQDYVEVGFNTPLHRACEKGNLEIVQMLMRAGANLNIRNKLGQTPLHIACRHNFPKIAEALLREDADMTIRDTMGCNASYYAKMNNMYTILESMPPPQTMTPEEIFDHRKFVHTVLNIKSKSGKKGKKGKKGKMGKKK